jgi:diphthamide synthase (EF-2-diphthine--ammonia ligase)
MSGRPRALIAWSSGKDSAWALHETRRAGAVEVVGALTTVTSEFGRERDGYAYADLLPIQS